MAFGQKHAGQNRKVVETQINTAISSLKKKTTVRLYKFYFKAGRDRWTMATILLFSIPSKSRFRSHQFYRVRVNPLIRLKRHSQRRCRQELLLVQSLL